MSNLKKSTTLVIATLLVCACAAWAQQITGTITGVVKDAQQAVVANAKVILTNVQQGNAREVNTSSDGSFVFTPVQPGLYNLTIEASGFKKSEQRDIRVSANDRISMPDLILTVGALNESVTVEASAVTIQAQSAERSGVLSNRQVNDLAMTGRNFLDLARTVPGIVYTGGLGGIQSNGGRGNQNNLLLDGITNVDTGSNGGALATTNPDMIAEFKIITNSQQAEFGRSSGAQINVVTKSGSKDFHGTGYLFHRHEGLNANSWRNNIENRPRQFYRYNFAGFNVGGPAYIPGKWNKEKEKLFFFVGIEWQNQLIPQARRDVTVPTDLERTGNFSQSFNDGGKAVRIIDPTTGAPFPNMTIPTNRINLDGQKILNRYPKPNALGVNPDFNYQTQFSDTYPRREYIYRGDYQINDKWRAYARYIRTFSQTNKNYGQWNADYNIPFGPMNFGDPGWSFIANVTTIINPTLTNEFIFGSSKNVLNIDPVDDAFDRGKLNLSYKMPFPDADKLNLVQNWRFGGVPNAPTSSFNGTPFRNFNHTYDTTDNIAKILGSHTLKAGIYLHKSLKDQTAFTPINGTIDFGRDGNNPGDTNWAFANALLGNFRTLEQSNVALNGQYRYWNVEWYVQDNWRVNSRLTLDYGLRFYWIQPQYDEALQTSSFNTALYDPKSAAVLRQPGRNAAGQSISVNPLTGEVGPAALVGSIINTGSGFVNGLYANGMGRAGQNGYPRGLMDGQGLLYAPRIGAAYRINNKTVLRFGGGMFYDRFQGNPVFDMLPNPPSTNRPTFYYGNLASIPPASAGVYFPANVNGFHKKGLIPTTYNFNFTVQRELPFGVLVDLGYVGSTSSHIINRINRNAIPLGAAWLPQNQDPLKDPLFDGSTTKAINFYRPYMGFADATTVDFAASSNYHSFQLGANRRMGRNLTFGVAYTFSKAMGVASDDGVGNNPFDTRKADYGLLTFDRQHNLVFNYVYNLPALIKSNSGAAKVAKLITNNWQISGITTMQSGAPSNISFGISGLSNLNERFTGSPNIGPRVVYTAPVTYNNSDQYARIGLNGFATPAVKGSRGFDSAVRPIRLPGDNNWDISIFKNFPMGAEMRYLQLRVEMFNAPNHTRYSDFGRTATFDKVGGTVINKSNVLGGNGGRFGFGALSATRDPRIIQLAAKFYF